MRILFFDIDGTLILTQGAGKVALKRTLKESFAVSVPDADIEYGGRTDLGIANELFVRNGLNPPTAAELNTFFSSYVRHLKLELAKNSGIILPGVEGLLQQLQHDNRYALGIITGNIKQGAHSKLVSHSLESFFSFGGYGDTKIHRNDIAREGLASASSALSLALAGKQCMIIGDTAHDIICSRAIGAFSLGVCTGYAAGASIAAQNPTRLVQDLSDTEQILDIIDSIFKSGF